MCWQGEVLTLEEYRKVVNEIKRICFDMFKESDDNTVYEAVLNFKDDEDLFAHGICTKVFKHFEAVEKYMLDELEFLVDADDEPIERRAYWSVTKFTLYNDEYEEDIICHFSTNASLLNVDLNAVCYNKFGRNDFWDEIKKLLNYNYMLISPKIVDVPYKIGDILKINALPYHENFYVVYGGEEMKIICKDVFNNNCNSRFHWCVYESEDRNGLWIDDLSDAGFTDFVRFICNPLDICEYVDDCPDQKIMKASKILKSNPQLWYELVSAKEKNIKRVEVNLEPWIFK